MSSPSYMDSMRYLIPFIRSVPAGLPGKSSLARLLLGHHLALTDIPVVDNWGNRYLVPNLSEPIAFYLLIDGVYEPRTMALLRRLLTLGSTFLDIGACLGTFTLPAAKWVGDQGLVLAIEPSACTYPLLAQHVKQSGFRNIRLRNCALSDRSCTMQFYEAPLRQFGMSSCVPRFHQSPTPVAAETLDAILADEKIHSVDVIKIDVEGYEWFVLQGAARLLTGSRKPLVLFEFMDWAENQALDRCAGDAQRLLRDYGYSIWRLSDFLRGDRQKICRDILIRGSEMLVASAK